MLPQSATLPDAKSRLRFLLHDADPHPSPPPAAPPPSSNPPSGPPCPTPLFPSSNLTTSVPSSAPDTPSTRLQALNLAAEPLPTAPLHSLTSNTIADRPLPPAAYRLPPLPTPVRARSADSAIVPTLPISNIVGSTTPTTTSPYIPDTLLPPHPLTPPTRSDSAISDISTGAPGITSRTLTAATHPPRNHAYPLAHLHSQMHGQTQLMPRDAASFSSGPSLESMHVVPAGTSTITAPSWDGARMGVTGSGVNPGNVSGLGNASDMSSALLNSVGSTSLQQSQQHAPPHAMAALPTAMSALLPSRRPAKTEAELRDKREMRRMKNRISAARSRQRKTDTFETLQRELSEAKTVIEALTRQLDRSHGARDLAAPGAPSAPPAPHVIAVPHDLRPAVGRDFVSVDVLMDMLRVYIRHAPP